MELGNELRPAEMNDDTPLAITPPEARFINTSPSTGSPEIIEFAVMSPYASMAVMMKMMLRDMNADKSNDSPYLNGTGRYTPPKLFTESKSIYPNIHDTT